MGMHGWRHRKGLHKGNLVSLDLEAGETEVWGEKEGQMRRSGHGRGKQQKSAVPVEFKSPTFACLVWFLRPTGSSPTVAVSLSSDGFHGD